MKILTALALVAGLLTAAISPAAAGQALKIQEDNGGVIVDYVKQYSNFRDADGKIVIDGPCMSACTIFLGIVRPENVCATKNAVLGFHSATARITGKDGKQIKQHAVEFSALMWNLYPTRVREKLTKLGWLGDDPTIPHPNFILISGFDLLELVRPCNGHELL